MILKGVFIEWVYECGRPPAMTKLGATRIHTLRVRGGNEKFRALRLDTGNFSWGSEGSLRSSIFDCIVYYLFFLPVNCIAILKM